MRPLISLALLACLALAVTAADTLHALGVSDAEARDGAISALQTGSVPIYSQVSKTFKGANATARVAMTMTALQWTKLYVESAAFHNEYAKLRNERRPELVSAEAEYNKQREDAKRELAEMKKNIASLPADQRAQAEEML